MNKISFALVLVSVFTHAYWNYLIKRSDNKHIFTALSKIAEIIIYLIPAIYFLCTIKFEPSFLLLITVAASITFLNYFFLAGAYKHGDLSLIYPVSRSSIIFLPFMAFFFIKEKIDFIGAGAVILIFLGTFVMHIESLNKKSISNVFKSMNNKGTIYAIVAALAVAGYTLWDKISVSKMEPFLYFYLYTFIIAVIYNSFNIVRYSGPEIKKEWKTNKYRIIQVGFFNGFTYIMVLTALTMSKATYVGGLRQLSIVVGVFLGYKFLGEKLTPTRILGIFLSLIGGSLIYFAN